MHITSLKKKTLCFHNIYEHATVFVFIENKNDEKLYSFFIIQIQLLGYWKWKLNLNAKTKPVF